MKKYSLNKYITLILFYFGSSFVLFEFNKPLLAASCYQACFTPYENCTHQIVSTINRAQYSIYMQAYSFTAKPILAALINAKKRNVHIQVILDKSHLSHPQLADSLAQENIPIWIDSPPGIAHNKVLIIDNQQVVTGSFNFSYAAQHKNHENVLFIQDKTLANQYLLNWKKCQLISKSFVPKRTKKQNQAKPVLQEYIITIITLILSMIKISDIHSL